MLEIFDLGLFKLGVFDIIDILFVAILIYQIYRLIRGTIAVNIFIGLLLVYLLWLSVKSLNMHLLSAILDKIIGVGTIALIIVFQQEIRRFLLIIGKNTFAGKSSFWQKRIFKIPGVADEQLDIVPILEACKDMSANQTGALIVFAKTHEEQIFANNGEEINAKISKRLLESIFSKSSPLHDGAVVITDNKIMLASCILPLTENTELPEQLGLRHRSALGITENSDAAAIVVSEETGHIAYSYRGKIKTNISLTQLEKFLSRDLS